MPAYDVICDRCGNEQEIYRRIKDYENRPFCCGEKMRIKLHAAYVPQEFQPYKSMITGEMITDRAQHKRHLKQHKCIEVGNEKIEPPKKSYEYSKKEQYELRRDIAQRLDAIA